MHRTLRSLVRLSSTAHSRPSPRPPKLDAPFDTSPVPTSSQSLYQSLLLITSNPRSSVRKVIDYYFDWPKALHSTKSFNLLISLALRNASFASVRRLFSAMRAESIPENMETWKLHVRWLVRAGRWNDAWKRVLDIIGKQIVTPANTIPLPLWLELFGSQQRGALRRWAACKPNTKYRYQDAGVHCGRRSCLDVSVPHTENSAPNPRKQFLPPPCQRPYTVELSKYRALMRVSPPLVSSDHVQILPRTVYIITQTMYRIGQRTMALSTALSYLKSLPPKLRRCDRRRVLDLVNLHLFMVARHRKPGLKQHFARRRVLRKFLHVRSDLTPSSATLFLLLGPLRGCRRSGTLAMQCMQLFVKRWGPRIQSSSVRRRVASLALKEGRLDIVAAMLKSERRCKIWDVTFSRTIYTSGRRPWRTLYSRRGLENRRWHVIEGRYQRRLTSALKGI